MSSQTKTGAKNWNVKEVKTGTVVASYDSEAKAKRAANSKNKTQGWDMFSVEGA